ncbi:hypothetical protein CDD82_3019 [Ophiocordyceps australis]|uniref:Uncharacterized protein n=1 Tax=Ophiocordyceps australis TaxID=1399860 RepID=A0A2C5ZFD2_9HYPO|nr:hypothetical protein CDD82_3019 [Ophiocordyceps australis]
MHDKEALPDDLVGNKKQPQTGNKDQYESLLSTDSESLDLDAVGMWSRRRRWSRASLLIVPVILSLLTAIVLVAVTSTNVANMNTILAQMETKSRPTGPSVVSSSVKTPTGDELGHCGDTVAEARALGCIFDPMSWAWQRPECYNADLVADFLARMDWRFYYSNNTLPSEQVPRQVWLSGDNPKLYTSRAWHAFHCTYSWRKLHEAFRSKKPMDNDILKLQHTMHCDTVFLHDLDPKLTADCDSWPDGCRITEVNAGFNSCGWY